MVSFLPTKCANDWHCSALRRGVSGLPLITLWGEACSCSVLTNLWSRQWGLVHGEEVMRKVLLRLKKEQVKQGGDLDAGMATPHSCEYGHLEQPQRVKLSLLLSLFLPTRPVPKSVAVSSEDHYALSC